MVGASMDPQTKLYLRFINATNETPKHPFGPVALDGATAVEYLRSGRMQPEQVLDHVLDDSLDYIAADARRLLGTSTMLNESVPFTYELAISGIVSTAVEFDKGEHGIVLPTIDILNQEQREHFISLAASPRSGRLAKIGMVLSDACTLLAPDSRVQKDFDEYQGTILEIARCYEDAPGDPRRMQELVEARRKLSEQLRVSLFLAMSPDLDPDASSVAARNLLRHTSSEALERKHFPAAH